MLQLYNIYHPKDGSDPKSGTYPAPIKHRENRPGSRSTPCCRRTSSTVPEPVRPQFRHLPYNDQGSMSTLTCKQDQARWTSESTLQALLVLLHRDSRTTLWCSCTIGQALLRCQSHRPRCCWTICGTASVARALVGDRVALAHWHCSQQPVCWPPSHGWPEQCQ
jgi:hypothetical protein